MLAEHGVQVTASQRHHAPGAMELLGANAALRLAPHADQPWDDLRKAVETLVQGTVLPSRPERISAVQLG